MLGFTIMKIEIDDEDIQSAPLIIQRQHCKYSDRDDNFTIYYPDIRVNPDLDDEVYNRMLGNLVDFIYDIGRLDHLKTAEQKKIFISMLSHKLQKKL